jgi:hypothetical protein
MKKMKYILGFMLMVTAMFISNSCTENIPTYESTTFIGCSDPGNLQILVCDALQTMYYGGAEVFLYLSDADRTNDPQRQNSFRKSSTPNTDPNINGAMFYTMPFQKYYFFARRDLGGGNIIQGSGEAFCPTCRTTTVTCTLN